MTAQPLPRGQRTTTRCRAGHDITEPGAMIPIGGGKTQCRACRLATLARYDARQKAKRLGVDVPPAATLRNVRHEISRAVVPTTFYTPRTAHLAGIAVDRVHAPDRSLGAVLPPDLRARVARAALDDHVDERVRDLIRGVFLSPCWRGSGHNLAAALLVQRLLDASADVEDDEQLRIDRVLAPIFAG